MGQPDQEFWNFRWIDLRQGRELQSRFGQCLMSFIDRIDRFLMIVQRLFSPRLYATMALTSLLAVTACLSAAAALPAATITPLTIPATIAKSANTLEKLPTTVSEAVLKDIMKSTGMQRTALKVVKAEARTWSDGCLGLADPGMMCTQALVPGWQVTVKSKRLRWIYRTNEDGTAIKLDRSASQLQDNARKPQVKSTRLADRDLPPPLAKGVLFRVMTSGGFTGQTQQTLLMNDGQMMQSRVNLDGTTSAPQISHVSAQQLQQFQQTLTAAHLEQLDRLSYPAAQGSADFLTVTLTSRSGTVQYAETVKVQLPNQVQVMIKAWDDMVQSAK
jgi:hypothetical protein